MQPASYGPRAGGPGFLIAPLKGEYADILAHIALRAEAQRVPQRDAQVLIWAVRAEQFDAILKNPLSKKLLTPEDIARMRAHMEVKRQKANLVANIQTNLPAPIHQMMELQAQFKDAMDRFNRGVATFEELERRAVLTGEPPKDPQERQIPFGTWQKMPGGYFARFGTDNYAKGVVEYYRPHRFRLKFDQLHRPLEVLNKDTSFRLSYEYHDNSTFVPHPAVPGLKAYPFKRVSIFIPKAETHLANDVTLEILHKGYILAGRPAGKKALLPHTPDGTMVWLVSNGDSDLQKQLSETSIDLAG